MERKSADTIGTVLVPWVGHYKYIFQIKYTEAIFSSCYGLQLGRGKSGPALGGTEYATDAVSVPADSASEIVKFTISILRESYTNAKAKYSSSVVPPDPSVHFTTAIRKMLIAI